MKRVRPIQHTVPVARPLVLFVEDDAANALVLRSRLSEELEVLSAQNDLEACDVVRARHAELHCVLMDIELRGSALNGTQLTQLFRGLPLDVELPAYARDLPVLKHPIIYITAHSAHFDDEQLLHTGADLIMAKPVSFVRLLFALGQVGAPPNPRGTPPDSITRTRQ